MTYYEPTEQDLKDYAQHRKEEKIMQRLQDWYEDPKLISHVTIAVPRTLKGDGCDHTYYQSVCSCGWHGDYKASKLTAQEDKCPNR